MIANWVVSDTSVATTDTWMVLLTVLAAGEV
jgi:hypothetical protein